MQILGFQSPALYSNCWGAQKNYYTVYRAGLWDLKTCTS